MALRRSPKSSQTVEIVDPSWLARALAVAVGTAAVLAYLSVCLLIYQGGWQRMLAPSGTLDRTPTALGLKFDEVRFDAGATGNPRLGGWWIPAETSGPTMLYLHGGQGTMAASLRTIGLLHRAGVNVFAFDYRGYGKSDGPHPTEARMMEDAEAALDYLVNTRHVAVGSIVPYGQGLGAVMAAKLLRGHAELPAVVIDDPDPGAFERVVSESRSRLLPMRMLMQERFDLANALAGSTKPKLLLANGPNEPDRTGSGTAENERFFRTVGDPKFSMTFAPPVKDDVYVETMRRFLDEYVGARSSR